MINSEILLRTILGPVRSNLRPLALAVNIADDLLFTQHLSMDDILVTKHIYPRVAQLIQKKPDATSKRIERLSRICWNSLKEQNLISFYLGRNLRRSPSPAALIIYLAVYAHFNAPFFTVIEQNPYFLFQSPPDGLPPPVLNESVITKAVLYKHDRQKGSLCNGFVIALRCSACIMCQSALLFGKHSDELASVPPAATEDGRFKVRLNLRLPDQLQRQDISM